MSTNPSDFPERVETIASYFDGYKAKLKEGTKKFFQFCVHSPALSNSKLETELGKWGRVHSFNVYECNLQAETSKVIGWLVYSMPFTNTNFLKSFMRNRSGHEWGFKYSTFTSTDEKIDWKLRVKALEIMVPADKENSARALISSTFKQHPSTQSHKTFSECYIYVGNKREHKEEMMATIFLEMVGRHKFQLAYLAFVPITVIIKSIDTKLATSDKKVQLTLREMILNLMSRDNKYGAQRLFQSIDFVPDPKKIWFNKVKGEGAACYYLTYYKWAEGEAQHTAEGLGAYLGQQYGHESLYSSFSADHWTYVKEWKWNVSKNKFDTPQEMNLAENVLYDPTAHLMRAIEEGKEDNVVQDMVEEVIPAGEAPTQAQQSTTDNDEVALLATQETTDHSTEPYAYNVHTAHNALSIAQSIQSASSMSSSGGSAPSLSLSQLAMQREAELARGQMDDDYNSVNLADGQLQNVNQVFHSDDVSNTSSMTDITDNTANKDYHHNVNDSASVTSHDTSFTLKSLGEEKLSKLLSKKMSTEEMEAAVSQALKDTQRKNQRKANMLLAKILQDQRKDEVQSASNCDAGSPK